MNACGGKESAEWVDLCCMRDEVLPDGLGVYGAPGRGVAGRRMPVEQSTVPTSTRIGVVDPQRVLSETNVGKKAKDMLASFAKIGRRSSSWKKKNCAEWKKIS